MPELAEIETVRRRMLKSMSDKRIKKIVLEEDDRFLFAFAKVSAVRKALVGAKVLGTGRKGKYFWLEFDRKPWPIFHLGMTGNIAILPAKSLKSGVFSRGWGGPKMWSEGKKPDAKDKRLWFSRLLMILDDGTEVALTDPRRFGRMWLSPSDPLDHPRIKKLGFDPLIDFPSVKVLELRLSKRRAPIKSVLLDQALFAGVGNWLADEILFQAKLSPHHLASDLNPAQVKVLRSKTLEVVKRAVQVSADYERFPASWLFHHRWGKNKNAKTRSGQKIVHESIGGRTAAWVPSVQNSVQK